MDIREIYGHPGVENERGLRVKEMINDVDKKRRSSYSCPVVKADNV